MSQSLEKNQLNQAVEHYLGEHQRIVSHLAGQACLQPLRAQALARFAELSFPSRTTPTWQYTSVIPVAKQPFSFTRPSNQRTFSGPPCAWLDSMDFHRLVFIDGYYVPSLSRLTELPCSVTVANLASLNTQQPELLEKFLHQAMTTTNGFVALNAAFFNDGAYIHLPATTHLDKPIELLFVTTTTQAQLAPIHNLIIAEESSQAIILEHYYSTQTNSYFNNVVTELVLNQKAQIEHYKLLQEGEQAAHIAQLRAQQQPHTDFRSYVLTLSGAFIRNEIHTQLSGVNAKCHLKGIYASRERQHVDHTTIIEHLAPHTSSHEHYNGIVGGQSRAVFNGKIIVHPTAYKTHAQQLNKNLLLSHDAEIDTKPELEILTDDVYCTHGATIGQLADEALFYLCSRGLPLAIARTMLIQAFTQEVAIPLIPPSILQSYLQESITHADSQT